MTNAFFILTRHQLFTILEAVRLLTDLCILFLIHVRESAVLDHVREMYIQYLDTL